MHQAKIMCQTCVICCSLCCSCDHGGGREDGYKAGSRCGCLLKVPFRPPYSRHQLDRKLDELQGLPYSLYLLNRKLDGLQGLPYCRYQLDRKLDQLQGLPYSQYQLDRKLDGLQGLPYSRYQLDRKLDGLQGLQTVSLVMGCLRSCDLSRTSICSILHYPARVSETKN
jgi:hypothetical protein